MLAHEAFSKAGISHEHIAKALDSVAGSSLSFSAKPGLVEITKTVYRDGKLHKQRYHVRKDGRVEPAIKAPKTPQATQQKPAGTTATATPRVHDNKPVDQDKINFLVNGWVKPSADYNSAHGGHVLRAAVAQKTGADFSKDAKRSDISPATQKVIEAKATKHQKELDYISGKSQAAHASEGDLVTLHRGIEGAQAEQIKQAIKEGKSVHLATDTVSSWTDDKATARGFGNVVVSIKVPRSSIVASYKAFPKQFIKEEREVAIATKGGLGPEHITGVSVY